MEITRLSFAIFLFLLFGCLAQPPQEQTWETYMYSTVEHGVPYLPSEFSIQHPGGMMVKEGDRLRYYLPVTFESGKEDGSLILVYYSDLAGSGVNLSDEPQAIASSVLSNNNRKGDWLGILDNATNKGGMQTFKTPRNYGAAEIKFNIASNKNGKILSGYALEIYDPSLKVIVAARILSANATLAKEIRDRYIETLTITPLKPAQDAQETAGYYCDSDNDCWCRVFTGAEFIPGKNPWYCNLEINRCEPCYYE